jgi:hypothetical protein
VIGALPLLLVAGLIEGLVSPSSLPDGWKMVMGLTLGLLLHAFLMGPSIRAWLGLGPRRRAPVLATAKAA